MSLYAKFQLSQEIEETNESLKELQTTLEKEHKKDSSTPYTIEIDDQSSQLPKRDSFSPSSSDSSIIDDGKRERKLLMGEMLKVSLDQPNYNATPFVCDSL